MKARVVVLTKPRAILLALTMPLLASCATDRLAGDRFRAERDLWEANWQEQRLSIRPEQVGEREWAALADRYEAIADRNPFASKAAGSMTSRLELQNVTARALFSAANIRGRLRDSLSVDRIFDRMSRDYADNPKIAAEVDLARALIAESRGELVKAADLYQTIVDRIEPDPESQGIAGTVLELPMRIAQLRIKASPETAPTQALDVARAYFERLMETHRADRIHLDAQARLAGVAAVGGDWGSSLRHLRDLESELLASERPVLDPSEIRLAISDVQSKAGADPDSLRATLTSFLRDYPQSEKAPLALLGLAVTAERQDRVDEALGYLDRLVEEHAGNEQAVAQALLHRARLLDRDDRWQEALATLRTLTNDHPLTEEALVAPLEIAAHYTRGGDPQARETALSQAEEEYRAFIERYPENQRTVFARERLIQTLRLQENYPAAFDEMVRLGDELKETPRGATFLVAAAGLAYTQMGDTVRALAVLDRVSELYSRAGIGAWASNEASQIRGVLSR